MQLLTRKQVAEAMQVSERTVYAWTADRRLRCVRLDKSVRYQPEDVQAFIAANLTSVVTNPELN